MIVPVARIPLAPSASCTPFHRRCTLRAALFLIAAYIGACPSATMLMAAGIQVIASRGTDSPDGNGEMSLFNAPALSATGQLAFISQLSGTAGGTSDNLGLYRSEPGGFTHIVRSGSSTLNGMTVTTFFPASPWIDATGTVVSIVGLGSTPVQIHTAIGDGGPLAPQVVPGSSSPSGNNTLLGVQSATVNDMGAAVFTAIYSGDNPELGLYARAVDGTITTRLLRNATAPRGGMITGVGRATINESAQVATIASVDAGAGAVSSALRIDGATVHELARQGDLAADGVTTLGGITSNSPLVNDGGQLAFAANYTQPSISRRGVFVADDASLRLLAPGLLPGSAAAASDIRVAGISSSGTVGFWAEMGAGIDPLSGMYVADAVGPTLVALEDTLIPSGGKYFRRFFTDAVSFSDGGHLAFLAELSETVNGAAAGRGLFYYDAQKGLLEIVKRQATRSWAAPLRTRACCSMARREQPRYRPPTQV